MLRATKTKKADTTKLYVDRQNMDSECRASFVSSVVSSALPPISSRNSSEPDAHCLRGFEPCPVISSGSFFCTRLIASLFYSTSTSGSLLPVKMCVQLQTCSLRFLGYLRPCYKAVSKAIWFFATTAWRYVYWEPRIQLVLSLVLKAAPSTSQWPDNLIRTFPVLPADMLLPETGHLHDVLRCCFFWAESS